MSGKAITDKREGSGPKKDPLTNPLDDCPSEDALEESCIIISQRENWGKAGSANETRIISFSIPSGVFTRGSDPRSGLRYQIVAEVLLLDGTEPSKVTDRIFSRPFKVGWLPASNLTDMNTIMAIALAGVLIMMAGTLMFESDPRNNSVLARDDFPVGSQLVTVEWPNLIVPIKYGFTPVKDWVYKSLGYSPDEPAGNAGNVTVTIYGNTSTILDVAVGPASNSTLNPISIMPHKEITRNDTGQISIVKYNFPFSIIHRGYVFNSTDPYEVTIGGLKQVFGEHSLNGTKTATRIAPFPSQLEFKWNIKTMDFPPIMYFWLVLTGVIFSRYITFHSDVTAPGTQSLQYRELMTRGNKKNPALWLIFSTVITLLVFGGFQDQLKYLTTNILVNLSIAFAFGFGFDKVLESTKKIPN